MNNLSFHLSLSFAAKSITSFALILIFSAIALAAGVLDPSFGNNGKAVIEIGSQAYVRATVIQPDGKIIIVGQVERPATQFDTVLIRLNPNGTLDTSFGSGGKVFAAISTASDYAQAAALAPDGKIIVVGTAQTPESTTDTDFFVSRFNSDGTFDTTFGNSGITFANQGNSDIFSAVILQPDGKIVATGSTSGDRAVVARFNPNGNLDTSFSGGFAFFDFPNYTQERFLAASLVANGRILVGGLAHYAPSFPVPYVDSGILALLESNGTLVSEFGNQGLASVGTEHFVFGFDLEILPDGKILTTGANTARLLSNGTIDPTFPMGGRGSRLAARSDGKVVIINYTSASFTRYTSIYADNGKFIGRAQNFGGNDVAVQSDNKILLVDSTQTEFTATRLASISSQATRLADFDVDEKTDFAVLNPSNASLSVRRANGNINVYNSGETASGLRHVIPERFITQLLTFNYWQTAGFAANSPAEFCGNDGAGNRQCVQWGMLGDVPVGGDYDGDAFTDYTVFRPSNGVWYVRQSSGNSQSFAVQWGTNGDKPVPADYDYDGITDFAVYRPSTGTWWIRRSSDNTYYGVQFGAASDIPLTGDYDGDGRADFVVFRPSNGVWYQYLTTEGFKATQFGFGTDIPVPGDYDGDGKHDIAVYRQGIWYLLQTTEGFKGVAFGDGNAVPVSVRYDE